MKFLLSVFLIAVLSFAACLFLPWWSIAVCAFIVLVFIPVKPWKAFLCGFIALFILWTILSLIISNNNDHLLASKMSVIILKMDSTAALIIITGLIGGIVAGFAALSGSLLQIIIRKK